MINSRFGGAGRPGTSGRSPGWNSGLVEKLYSCRRGPVSPTEWLFQCAQSADLLFVPELQLRANHSLHSPGSFNSLSDTSATSSATARRYLTSASKHTSGNRSSWTGRNHQLFFINFLFLAIWMDCKSAELDSKCFIIKLKHCYVSTKSNPQLYLYDSCYSCIFYWAELCVSAAP